MTFIYPTINRPVSSNVLCQYGAVERSLRGRPARQQVISEHLVLCPFCTTAFCQWLGSGGKDETETVAENTSETFDTRRAFFSFCV